MLRFCEACNRCSFYFLASMIKICIVKTAFAGSYLKLCQPMFLKGLPTFSLMFLIDMFLIKENVYCISAMRNLHVVSWQLEMKVSQTCKRQLESVVC